MDDVERNKENILKLKDNLVKTPREGIDLKIEYDSILSKKERLLRKYHMMEMEKDALNV